MEVEATRQTITVNKLVSTKKETIIIEGDTIVPDVKPDILNTIDTAGNVCIYKKETLDGKVRFDGCINLNIVYLADSDSDSVRGLTTTLDFTQMIDVDNCMNGMSLKSNISIKNIDCKVLNGRKVNTKVTLEVEVSVFSNENVEILKQINNIKEIQTLNSNMQINNLVGQASCRASAKDNISIDEESSLAEILKTEIKLLNCEMKTSYNKVLLKADVNVKIMYLTENGEIKLIAANIPVMGFADINDVSENNILSCNYDIKNMIIKPNSPEQHSIYVEIEFEINCDAVDTLDITLIQDMYCPCMNLKYNQKEVTTMTNKQITNNTFNIREKISVPEISNNKIYDVEITPTINNANVLNGRIVYEGELKLNFIFSSNDNKRIDTKMYTLPFTFNLDNNDINSNKVVNTKVNCINDEFVIASDGMIECKVDLMFELEMYNNTNINIMNEIDIEENNVNSSPSMIVHIVKQGDTLWNIAKQHNTTVEEIVNVNKIEDPNNISIGQKLFIPRFNRTKIGNIA